ncbi:hypothetical protein O3M35_012118 [Rhynocoris fuscipes]|uniref:Uncharacterized protein n=1 Tax=Rhynocoris fuscipes TaxID=488301 RepID=A0AAW1CUF5_9HEMI
MTSLYTYLYIKCLPGHHMLYHNNMSSYHMLNKKNLMWPTHDFLVHLFIYKMFAGSSYHMLNLKKINIILINKKYVKFELFVWA